MANTKISALTALTGADLANDDAFAVVDTSATATKKITVAELKLGIMPAPGPIGGTTPSTGAFTTLSVTGAATLTAVSDTTTSTLVLSNSTNNTIEAYASTASADQKRWGWQSGSAIGDGVYRLRALNDARTSGISALTFQRTGIASVTAAFGGSVSTTTGMAVGGATPGTGGLAFPATAVAVADANTLDDYEEGVAPVTLTCGTSGTITLNGSPYERLAYTKVGRKVTLLGLLTVASVSSPVGTLNISGLPFTIGSSASLAAEGGASITYAIATQTAAIAPIYGAASSTVATIFTRFASGSRSSNAADIQAGTELYINFTYFI